MKKAFFLLALISLSFASLLWQFGTDGPISAKPVIYQNLVVVASDDGNVYALDPATGAKRWQASVGGTPGDPMMADNAIYVPVDEGKVAKIGAGGAVQWVADLRPKETNVSRIYGIGITSNTIFVTANNGVYALEKGGTLRSRLMSFNDSVLTAPAAGADFIIFGKDDELVKMTQTGAIQWRARIYDGVFWISKPVIEDGVVYVGGLDDRMHAFSVNNGLELWDFRTKSWVGGTPLVQDGVVYFGGNDGNTYALDAGSGKPRWSSQTQLAVISQPESGIMGGGDVVFVGSTDQNVYAMSKSSGEIVWKGSATGAAGSPLFYQNRVVFGAGDGRAYAYSTERACSITSPLEGDEAGRKEVEVRGKYVSEAGSAKIMVRINSGEWMEADTGQVDWVYYVDPSKSLVSGLNTISCQVADAGGSEMGQTHTTVTITHNPTAALSDLVVTVSPDIVEGQPFTIYVNDGDDGSPVNRFGISFDSVSSQSDKNYTTTINEAGNYQVSVKKIGFRDATVNITVNSSGISPLYLGIGIVLLLASFWVLWTRLLKQRFAKKK
ncbi:MAG: PQQ-binding-like beta-propeller repeat protein [Candidatus Micrarchaeota archaeon]